MKVTHTMEGEQQELKLLQMNFDLGMEHMKLQKEVDSLQTHLYQQKLKILSHEGLTDALVVVLDELKLAKQGKRIVLSDETREFMNFSGTSASYLKRRARKVLDDME